MTKLKPHVSIGIPVYNGENYLAEAIESLLTQTYTDLEVIICDNASTDGTERISRTFAQKDSRIRYERAEHNVGAAGNFNRVFELARGDYFKWAAHDDVCGPDFLSSTVAVLDDDPNVVLCCPKISLIDSEGDRLHDSYDIKLATDSPDPALRFREIIRGVRGHRCYEVFGLIRASALRRTDLMGNYPHGDGVLLAQLALIGRFIETPNRAFFPRTHMDQSMSAMTDRYQYAAWFDPSRAGKILLPYWRVFWEYSRSVGRARISMAKKLRCCGYLCRSLVSYRRKLVRDVARAIRYTLSRRRLNPKQHARIGS